MYSAAPNPIQDIEGGGAAYAHHAYAAGAGRRRDGADRVGVNVHRCGISADLTRLSMQCLHATQAMHATQATLTTARLDK